MRTQLYCSLKYYKITIYHTKRTKLHILIRQVLFMYVQLIDSLSRMPAEYNVRLRSSERDVHAFSTVIGSKR